MDVQELFLEISELLPYIFALNRCKAYTIVICKYKLYESISRVSELNRDILSMRYIFRQDGSVCFPIHVLLFIGLTNLSGYFYSPENDPAWIDLQEFRREFSAIQLPSKVTHYGLLWADKPFVPASILARG